MASAVSESCQLTIGDVMWCQNGRSSYRLLFRKRHSTLPDITVRMAWHGKLRINDRLRSTSQCDDHVDMVLSFYWVSSILSLIWLFLLYGQQLRNQAQIRLIVHFSCYIYFPVADMEAGLPDVTGTGDDSGGVFTGFAPPSTRSTSKSASLQCNQPPPRHLFDSCGPIFSVLPGLRHGLRQHQGVRRNQLQPTV